MAKKNKREMNYLTRMKKDNTTIDGRQKLYDMERQTPKSYKTKYRLQPKERFAQA
jgi:hypothetical protein